MAGSSSKVVEGKKKARIEIIPLIDVIFFLLATFVLFTLSLNKLASVPINLPVPTVVPSPPDPDMVTLQVSDSRTLFWNRDPIQLDELPAQLANLKAKVPNPRILIAGDDKAKFGITIQALDDIRKAGIAQVSVETRTRPTGR